jgi:hypothetical protein
MTTKTQNPIDRQYSVAFVREDGSWEIAETFWITDSRRIDTADADKLANDHADENYAGRDWYVLDDQGQNINGGCDQE